jgi:short-subunit dehydrogenase
MKQNANKNVLITGSRGGIGRDSAVALARLGYHVFATVHREESVEELKNYAKEKGASLEVFKLDITDSEDRKKIINLDIDILINNAGIGESGSLTEIPMERVRNNFETNVFGTIELSQIVLKEMMKKDSGKVIIISSIAGRLPMAFWGAYSMTKFSLSAASDIMRQELKMITKNVHVITVEPGTYHTGFNQKVMATKYTWMNKNSYFHKIIAKLKQKEESSFATLERKSNDSIVNQILKAVEVDQPRLRYTAPWWQAAGAQLMRIFGK